jgi:hypothetical protein
MSMPAFFPPRSERPALGLDLQDLPFPLALTYSRLEDELDRQEPVAAAWQVRDALECTLKFTATLAVADCLNAAPEPALAGELLTLLFKPMSLGDWHTLLEKALKPLRPFVSEGRTAESGRCLPQLHEVFFIPRSGKRSPLGQLLAGTEKDLGLVRWRNAVFGHGVFRQEREFYASMTLHWLPRLQDWLRALGTVLAGWSLVGRTPGDERVFWQGTLGLPPVPPHEHQPWGEPLAMLLAHTDGRELPLDPLLSVQECAEPLLSPATTPR